MSSSPTTKSTAPIATTSSGSVTPEELALLQARKLKATSFGQTTPIRSLVTAEEEEDKVPAEDCDEEEITAIASVPFGEKEV